MVNGICRKFSSIWTTKFDTPLALNYFVCAATYSILLVYCILSLYCGDVSSIEEMSKEEKLIRQLQFYMDAFFPSTVTLVISIIVQNIIEGFKKKNAKWSLTAIAIVVMVIYVMVCIRLREIMGLSKFVIIVLLTIGLLILCFLAISQIQFSSKKFSGISGRL